VILRKTSSLCREHCRRFARPAETFAGQREQVCVRNLVELPAMGGLEDNRLEFNRIIPRKGRGYGEGCWHHLAGLEALCRCCHVRATRRQRTDRVCVKAG
jgi:hypothetical protein